ncbi:cytochrome P450 [Jatrophihabitans sp.]|uniref:cytochrome P450 n=1 Tax=Jatrophihabitans sp. TaxID=1932789 RepID=UPI002C957D50|nr:cytochrome P450 [Jatrophihabitans sp.]
MTSELAFSSAEVIGDPYPHFAAARARAGVQWHDRTGMWLAFGYAEANAVLRSRTLGRIWTPRWPDVPMPGFELIHRNSMLENEPPAHTRLRRLVAGAFARGHVERLRPRVAALADRLADGLAEAGRDGRAVDLIAGFAEPLPVQVIAELLGVPEADRALLRPWSNAIVKMYEYQVSDAQRNAAETAAREFVAYLRELVAQRRRRPEPDLISSLFAETDSAGARLDEDELVTTCTLLLNAGHEASVNVVGNGVLALFGHPEQWQRLLEAEAAGRSLVDTGVEELIRFDSPLQLFERTAIADTRIGEVTVRTGEKVAALLGSANRDPAVFDDPDRLDVGRTDNPHLGFGAGIHFCLGAPLARVELQTSLRTLLRRFPGLRPAVVDLTGLRRAEFVIRGVSSLPVHLS